MADLAAVSKHKRPPLPGAARPPPFRADPVIDRALGRPSSVGKMLQGAPHPPRGEPTTDASLMSSMMARLSALEKQVQQAQRDMAQKDEVIRGLNATVADLKMSAGACSDEETEALRREYKRMQKRVHDMETFLADYGMVWVGASDSDEESPPSQAPPQAPPKETKTWNPEAAVVGEFVVDYDKIIKNIEELNVIAGEGIAAIRSVPGGARLQAPESVPLRLYANGILMYAGPFRPFTEETAQSCVRDLMEGYFPWELKERYPDGVPLQIFDHRHEQYSRQRPQGFPGEGYQLASVSEEAQREAFLKRLPASVVRNGHIVDVRGGIKEAIEGAKHKTTTTVVETKVVQAMAAPDGPAPADVATLQVKSHTGAETLVLKLRFNDTVGDVYGHVQKHFAGVSFKLTTTYPKKLLEDHSATLVAAGLTPNAVLRMILNK